MEQLTPALRSSVASNTSIKMAGGVSDRDARMLDADMRTTSEFIASMRKRREGDRVRRLHPQRDADRGSARSSLRHDWSKRRA